MTWRHQLALWLAPDLIPAAEYRDMRDICDVAIAGWKAANVLANQINQYFQAVTKRLTTLCDQMNQISGSVVNFSDIEPSLCQHEVEGFIPDGEGGFKWDGKNPGCCIKCGKPIY